MKKFEVKENHIKLLKNLYIGWCDTEFGSPCIDPKRPFGNSDVYSDMAEILGIKLPDEEENYEEYQKITNNLYKGYLDLQVCLQILCSNLSIEVGVYEAEDYTTNWHKV